MNHLISSRQQAIRLPNGELLFLWLRIQSLSLDMHSRAKIPKRKIKQSFRQNEFLDKIGILPECDKEGW